MVGEYLKERFHQFSEQARRNGIHIKFISQCEAVDIDKDEYGSGVVLLSDGRKILSSNIIIATGHWEISRFQGVKGYFSSPWPAKKLLRQAPDEHIGIIGSSLSAIDAALTLSTKFGEYKRSLNGELSYRKNPNAEIFRMTMYSRSGQLPEVMGVVVNKIFTHKSYIPRTSEPFF